MPLAGDSWCPWQTGFLCCGLYSQLGDSSEGLLHPPSGENVLFAVRRAVCDSHQLSPASGSPSAAKLSQGHSSRQPPQPSTVDGGDSGAWRPCPAWDLSTQWSVLPSSCKSCVSATSSAGFHNRRKRNGKDRLQRKVPSWCQL